jgi:acylphosphatase
MENSKPSSSKAGSTVTASADDTAQGGSCRIVHLRVTGRVQGVCFRAWTAELAATLALEGWVRNRRDGSVEALISGSADAVARMVGSCHRGPPGARVATVEIMQEGGAAPSGFAILPTA